MIRKSREKFLPAALLLSFSLTNLIVYFVLAPWTAADSTTIHWPLSGYLPLLVFLPEGIRFIYAWACSKQTVRFSRILVNIIPAVGLCGTFAALIGIGSQAFQTSLQKILGDDILSTKMAGWRQFAEHTHEVISDIDSNTRPIIVTDNYYTAAQLEFAGVQAKVYTIDKSKAERDGRIRQYRIWKKHENGLTEHFHKPALFITEDSTLTTPEKHEIIQEINDIISEWYTCSPHMDRAMPANVLKKLILQETNNEVKAFETVDLAIKEELKQDDSDLVLVFGSFFTVSEAYESLSQLKQIEL